MSSAVMWPNLAYFKLIPTSFCSRAPWCLKGQFRVSRRNKMSSELEEKVSLNILISEADMCPLWL